MTLEKRINIGEPKERLIVQERCDFPCARYAFVEGRVLLMEAKTLLRKDYSLVLRRPSRSL